MAKIGRKPIASKIKQRPPPPAPTRAVKKPVLKARRGR